MLRLIAVLSLSVACLAPAHADAPVELSAPQEDGYASLQDGVALLSCYSEHHDAPRSSRAVLLDIPELREAGFDVLLASRHGVTDEGAPRACRVRGFEDPEDGAIARIVAPPPDPERGFEDDWAILVTAQRLPRELPRLRAADFVTPPYGEVTMVARANERQACRITEGPEGQASEALIFHDCPSRAGLSGTPIVGEFEGRAFIIGVHLGKMRQIPHQDRSWNVARRLNGEFSASLIALVDEELRRRAR